MKTTASYRNNGTTIGAATNRRGRIAATMCGRANQGVGEREKIFFT